MSAFRTPSGKWLISIGSVAGALTATWVAYDILVRPILASELPAAGLARVAQLEQAVDDLANGVSTQSTLTAAGLCTLYRRLVAQAEVSVAQNLNDAEARARLEEYRGLRDIYCARAQAGR